MSNPVSSRIERAFAIRGLPDDNRRFSATMLRALAFLVQAAAMISALAGAGVALLYGVPALQQMLTGERVDVPTVTVAGHDFSAPALVALLLGCALALYLVGRSLQREGSP